MVTPEPEMAAVELVAKPVPVNVTLVVLAGSAVAGLIAVSVDAAVMVKVT